MLISLSEVNIENIRNMVLENVVPELYELEGLIENNASHIKDPVLTHVLSVLTELTNLLENAGERVNNYLNQKVDSHSRKELLLFIAAFHDIGKRSTLKKDGETVTFPGHEKEGAENLKSILSRFDLSEKEKGLVIQVIGNHGFFHNALDHPEDNLQQKVESFRKEHGNVFLEVALLTLADILGSHLKKNKPALFDFKVDFLREIINS